MRRLFPWLVVVLAVLGTAWILKDALLGESGPGSGYADGTGKSSGDVDDETDEEWEADWNAALGLDHADALRLGGHGKEAPAEGEGPGKEKPEDEPEAEGTGAKVAFGGTVKGSDGRAAPGVAVRIGRGQAWVRKLETDARGQFKTKLPAGRYELALHGEGIGGLYLPAYLVDGASGTDLMFPLERLVRLDVVVKREGEPVEGANVACVEIRGMGGAALKTDAVGLAVFEEVVAGTYRVVVGMRSREEIVRRQQIRKDTTLVVDVPRGVAVRGFVEDGDAGGAVVGATVRASVRGPKNLWFTVTTETTYDGQYELEMPRGRVVRFDAVADDFAPWPERRRISRVLKRLRPVARGQAVEVPIQLVRGLVLTGRATDGEGEAVAGLELRVQPRRGPALSATTDSEGSYLVSGVAPERYRVVVLTKGWFSEEALQVTVPRLGPGASHTYDFAVHRTITVEGEVLFGDQSPAVGARVWITGGGKPLRAARNAGRRLETFTDERGRWRLDDLPPKRSVVARATLGSLEARPRGFRTDKLPTMPLRLRLSPTVVLEGTVVDTNTRNGVSRARVEVRPEGKPGGRSRRNLATNAEGAFEVADLIPGTWVLRPSHRSYLKAEPFRIDLAEGDGQREVTLNLDPGFAIGGTVTDPSGRSLAGVRARVFGTNRDGVAVPSRSATTNARGEFRLTGFESGLYTVRASLKGYRSAKVENLRGGEDRLRVQLRPIAPR